MACHSRWSQRVLLISHVHTVTITPAIMASSLILLLLPLLLLLCNVLPLLYGNLLDLLQLRKRFWMIWLQTQDLAQ